jgi:hypothetical protein
MAKGTAARTQIDTEAAFKSVKGSRSASAKNHARDRFQEVLTVAKERGLLSGSRTHVVRGRMPVGLVEQAKLKSGITSESKLIEVALANLAVSDDYAQWLLSQRGTIPAELDLEF